MGVSPDTPLADDDPIPAGTDSEPTIHGLLNFLEDHWLSKLLGGKAAGSDLTLTFERASDRIIGVTVAFDGSATWEDFVPVGITTRTVSPSRRASGCVVSKTPARVPPMPLAQARAVCLALPLGFW